MGADDLDSAARRDHARLLSLAAHELRSPVSVVGGYLRMLQRDAGAALSAAQRKVIDDALAACARLAALADELSEVARLDAGDPPPGREACDLFGLLAAAVDGLGRASGARRHVVVEVPGRPAPLVGERANLQRVLAILIEAVIRERPPSAAVVARGHVGDEADGPAMVVVGTADEVERALDAPREALDIWRGGLGLGLPIALRILSRHGGAAWAAGSAAGRPGRGAVVVSVPMRRGSSRG